MRIPSGSPAKTGTRTFLAIENRPILVLATSRERFDGNWSELPYAVSLELQRLQGSHCRELIAKLAGDARLPTAVVTQIVEHTDGIPLFLEEFTKSVIENQVDPDTKAARRMPQCDEAG